MPLTWRVAPAAPGNSGGTWHNHAGDQQPRRGDCVFRDLEGNLVRIRALRLSRPEEVLRNG
jgi:hypothetical protein